MTREDAIFFLNELRSANNFDETIEMAIAALSEPAIEENGLARCGCGGKAHLWPDGRESRTYHVVCCKCRASAHYFVNEQEAKDAWNRAMGYKEADE